MSDATPPATGAARRLARPRRSVPRVDPALARLSEMLLALLSEVTVIRERLDTVERLLEASGVLAQRDIDLFVPDAAATAARDALRRRHIHKVMRPLLDDTERMGGEPAGLP